MRFKLFAFDLDGTLLKSDKSLSSANAKALCEMEAAGAIVALASGRLGSSVAQYSKTYGFSPAILSLNGAAVYNRIQDGNNLVYSANLDNTYADYLVSYAHNADVLLNYYHDGKLFAENKKSTQKWVQLYFSQTSTEYHFVNSLSTMNGTQPHKLLFVGDPHEIDRQEALFKAKWGSEVYIVRTWEYYLEFMSPKANKGNGLASLAMSYGIDLANVAAFGDADNDVPMLACAGLSCAMKNGSEMAKKHARYVSKYHHDEDAIAKEWELIKAGAYDNL